MQHCLACVYGSDTIRIIAEKSPFLKWTFFNIMCCIKEQKIKESNIHHYGIWLLDKPNQLHGKYDLFSPLIFLGWVGLEAFWSFSVVWFWFWDFFFLFCCYLFAGVFPFSFFLYSIVSESVCFLSTEVSSQLQQCELPTILTLANLDHKVQIIKIFLLLILSSVFALYKQVNSQILKYTWPNIFN